MSDAISCFGRWLMIGLSDGIFGQLLPLPLIRFTLAPSSLIRHDRGLL
jgi:hypothetical protein